MVREADAVTLVADVALALAARGHDVQLDGVNGPRLVRLGALMLAEFGVGAQDQEGKPDRG
jgi:hypothetical protein